MDFPANALVYNAVVVTTILVSAWLSFFGARRKELLRLIVSFSAGVLLSVSFLHMIPESLHLIGELGGLFVLLGYLSIYFLERFAMVHPCEEGDCDYHTVGLAAFLGLSLHSLMGGVALGSSLLVPGLGTAVFLATVLHKAPESFSLTSLLILGKKSRMQLIGYMSLFSLMVPMGTLIAMWGLEPFGHKVVGAAVAISAGTFLHIASGDLLPGTHTHGRDKMKNLISFIIGVSVSIAGYWILERGA